MSDSLMCECVGERVNERPLQKRFWGAVKVLVTLHISIYQFIIVAKPYTVSLSIDSYTSLPKEKLACIRIMHYSVVVLRPHPLYACGLSH